MWSLKQTHIYISPMFIRIQQLMLVTWKQVASGSRVPIRTQCRIKNKAVMSSRFEHAGCWPSSSMGPDTRLPCSHSALIWHSTKSGDCDILRVTSSQCPGETELCRLPFLISLINSKGIFAMLLPATSSIPHFHVPPLLSCPSLKTTPFRPSRGRPFLLGTEPALSCRRQRHKLWDFLNEVIRTVSKSARMG